MNTRSLAGQEHGDVPDSLFSETARDHARSPRNMGVLEPPCHHGSRTGDCGDRMDFWVEVKDAAVVRVSFTTTGCGSSRACASMTTELALGQSVEQVLSLTAQDVLGALGTFPESSRHCAELSVGALHAACAPWVIPGSAPAFGKTLMVLSGKGGVGKSMLVANLASSLSRQGLRVGVLDIDLHGPNLPALLGMEDEVVERLEDRLQPAEREGIKVMSMAFLLPDPDQAVVWKGMKKGILVQQFVQEVAWGELDLLLIDAPAGTGDEPIAIVNTLGGLDGALVVTTSSRSSLEDARKAVNFCHEMKVPVLGLVENMAGRTSDPVREGAVRAMAMDMDVPLLGVLPMDDAVELAAEAGTPFVASSPEREISRRIEAMASCLQESLGLRQACDCSCSCA